MASTVVGFGLLLVRATSIFMVAPIIGAKTVPPRVRMGFALAIAAVGAAYAGIANVPTDNRALLEAMASEIALGLLVGTTARVFIEAAQAAGQTLGLAAGLGFGATLDPIHGAPSTSVGELISLTAVGMAVSMGLHKELFVWFCSSARAVPPGSASNVMAFAEAAVTGSLQSIALAVRLSFPVIAATTSVHLVVGLVGRAVPQMSLSNVGFAVPLLAGGWALSLCANDIAALAAQAALEALHGLR